MLTQIINNRYQLVFSLVTLLVDIWAFYSEKRLLFIVGLVTTVIFLETFKGYFKKLLQYKKDINWQNNAHQLSSEMAKDPNSMVKIVTRKAEFNKGAISAYKKIMTWVEDEHITDKQFKDRLISRLESMVCALDEEV